jgi:hypothetical protein
MTPSNNVLMVFVACQAIESRTGIRIPEISNDLREHERRPYAQRRAGRGIEKLRPTDAVAARRGRPGRLPSSRPTALDFNSYWSIVIGLQAAVCCCERRTNAPNEAIGNLGDVQSNGLDSIPGRTKPLNRKYARGVPRSPVEATAERDAVC